MKVDSFGVTWIGNLPYCFCHRSGKPAEVDANLTITPKAIEMLSEAFGEDRSHALLVGVLSGGCSGYMYDLQIVESTEIDCQENIDGFRY